MYKKIFKTTRKIEPTRTSFYVLIMRGSLTISSHLCGKGVAKVRLSVGKYSGKGSARFGKESAKCCGKESAKCGKGSAKCGQDFAKCDKGSAFWPGIWQVWCEIGGQGISQEW